MVRAAEGGRDFVVDLPSMIALRSIVRPPYDVPVSIDAVVGGRVAVERATSRPSGDLVLLRAGNSANDGHEGVVSR